jgi:hypothetical protein
MKFYRDFKTPHEGERREREMNGKDLKMENPYRKYEKVRRSLSDLHNLLWEAYCLDNRGIEAREYYPEFYRDIQDLAKKWERKICEKKREVKV